MRRGFRRLGANIRLFAGIARLLHQRAGDAFQAVGRLGDGRGHPADRGFEFLRQSHHVAGARLLRSLALFGALGVLQLGGVAQADLEGLDGAGHFAHFVLLVQSRQRPHRRRLAS